jgi:deoxyribodipyrimidine photolyase
MNTVLFWFRNCLRLHDYDMYSNRDHWLCIAGRGTDPRSCRPMWGTL